MTEITHHTHWVSRDGRVTPIREMEDGHLVNTVRMLRRKTQLAADQIAFAEVGRMVAYAKDAPDGAYDAVMEEIEHAFDRENLDRIVAERMPVFVALVCELHRRKIKLVE